MHRRTPGTAARRAWGMGAPHSSQAELPAKAKRWRRLRQSLESSQTEDSQPEGIQPGDGQ